MDSAVRTPHVPPAPPELRPSSPPPSSPPVTSPPGSPPRMARHSGSGVSSPPRRPGTLRDPPLTAGTLTSDDPPPIGSLVARGLLLVLALWVFVVLGKWLQLAIWPGGAAPMFLGTEMQPLVFQPTSGGGGAPGNPAGGVLTSSEIALANSAPYSGAGGGGGGGAPSWMPRIGLTREDVFVMVHVSDIHLSVFSRARTGEFCRFASLVAGVLRPDFTVVSGDITDAKDATQIRSEVYRDEWMAYCECLSAANFPDPSRWMDVHGNHDRFAVPHISNSDRSLWDCSQAAAAALRMNHGDEKAVSTLHWSRSFTVRNASVSVLGIDLAPSIGLPRPVNFFGVLDTASLDWLEAELERNADATVKVVVGHYPLSTVTDTARSSKGRGLVPILHHYNVTSYLCGHYHTLLGIVDRMHTFHGASHGMGLLELELADFKDTRRFRVLAVSEGVLSFVDVPFEKDPAPVVLPLRPLDARYVMDDVPAAQVHSRVLRVMTFSEAAVTSVTVELRVRWSWFSLPSLSMFDNLRDFEVLAADEERKRARGARFVYSLARVDENMYEYVIPEVPSVFAQGCHEAVIRAVNAEGLETVYAYPFSFDGTPVHLWHRAAILLTYPVGQFLWGLSLLSFAVSGYLLLRPVVVPRVRGRFAAFRTYDRVAYTAVVLEWGTMIVFPWFIGPVFSRGSMWSAFFYFGLVHLDLQDGRFLTMQTWDTYFWVLRFLACVWMPTVLFLVAHAPVPSIVPPRTLLSVLPRQLLRTYLPAALLAISNLGHIYYLSLCYGWIAAVLSPCVTWYSLVNLVLMSRSLVRSLRTVSCDPKLVQ